MSRTYTLPLGLNDRVEAYVEDEKKWLTGVVYRVEYGVGPAFTQGWLYTIAFLEMREVTPGGVPLEYVYAYGRYYESDIGETLFPLGEREQKEKPLG